MLLVCDPVCHGQQHVPVNSGLLKIIRTAFPSRTVSFFAQKTHLDFVREQLKNEPGNDIIWKKLDVPHPYTPFFQRFVPDLRLVAHIFSQASQGPCSDIIFAASTPSTIWAVKILLDSRYRHLRVHIILHGELSTINGWRSRNPYFRLQDIRTALTIGNSKRIKYIVLEEPIRDLAVQKLPGLKEKIGFIDHPLPQYGDDITPAAFNPPLHFGFLGLATKQKGFFKFLEVAEIIVSKYPEKARFHLIGRIHSDYRNSDLPGLKFLATSADKAPLERREFIDRLKALHYVCLFFQGSHYDYSASGVLLDCVAWEKPVMATPTPTIRQLDKKYGEIGYICDSADMVRMIESVIQNQDASRYHNQIAGMRRVKQSRSLPAQAMKLRYLLNS
jgi:hypothetical protein